jgi:hypothetical protein
VFTIAYLAIEGGKYTALIKRVKLSSSVFTSYAELTLFEVLTYAMSLNELVQVVRHGA